MAPLRRDLGQWAHDEAALVRPRMRRLQARLVDDAPAIGDEVDVEGARGVGFGPAAAKARFDGEDGLQHGARSKARLDKHDAVAIRRTVWVGPGGGAPPARPPDDAQAGARQGRKGRFQERFEAGIIPGQIAAEREDDGLVLGGGATIRNGRNQ